MVAKLLLSVLLIGVASAARIPDKDIAVYFTCQDNSYAWNDMHVHDFCRTHSVSIFNMGATGDVSVRIYGVTAEDYSEAEADLIWSYSPELTSYIPSDVISEFGTTNGNDYFDFAHQLSMDSSSCSSYCLVAFADFDGVISTFVGGRCLPIDCNDVHASNGTRDVVVEINQIEDGTINLYQDDDTYMAHIGSVVDSVTVRLDWGPEVRPISEDWPLTVVAFLTWTWEDHECDGNGRFWYDFHDTTATFFTRNTPLAEGDSWTIDTSDLVMKFGPGRCAKCGDVKLAFQFDPFNMLQETDSDKCNNGATAPFNLECSETDIFNDDNSWTLTADTDGVSPSDRAFIYMCSMNNHNGGVSMYPMGGKIFFPDWSSDGQHYTRVAADLRRHIIDDDAALCASVEEDMENYGDMSWEGQNIPSVTLAPAMGQEYIDYEDDGTRVSIYEDFDDMVALCADKVQNDESVRHASYEFREAGCAAMINKLMHNLECPDKVMYYNDEVDVMKAFMDVLDVNPQYSAMVEYFSHESWETGLEGINVDSCARSALTYNVLGDTNFLSRVMGHDHELSSDRLYNKAMEFFSFFLSDDDGSVSWHLNYLRLCSTPHPWQKANALPIYYKGEGEFAVIGFPKYHSIQWTRVARMFCNGC